MLNQYLQLDQEGVSVASCNLLPETEHEWLPWCPKMLFHTHHNKAHPRCKVYRQIGKSFWRHRHLPYWSTRSKAIASSNPLTRWIDAISLVFKTGAPGTWRPAWGIDELPKMILVSDSAWASRIEKFFLLVGWEELQVVDLAGERAGKVDLGGVRG